MIRRGGVALVALVVFALAGCTAAEVAPVTAPHAHPQTSASAAPAPTALPACADFVAPTAFGATLGADVATPPQVYPLGVFAAVGGVGCTMNFGQEGFENGAQLMLQVVPASIATPAELSGSLAEAGTPACQTDPDIMRSNAGCEAVAVIGGWWVETHFFVNSSSETQTAAVQPVLDLIRAGLRGHAAPQVTAVTAPSCDRFGPAVAGDPSYAGGTVTASAPPDDAGDTRGGWPAVAVGRVVAVAACQIAASDGSTLPFSFVRSPAVAAACAASPGTTAWPDTAGLTLASTPYVSGGADLCATDGVGSVTTGGAFTATDPSGPHWDAAAVAGIAPLLAKLLAAAR